MVLLRVRPQAADVASEALDLPPALQWRAGDPATHWLGPDQWLHTSDTRAAEDITGHISHSLSDQLHATTDMSSATVCFALKGPATRTILAMGCGIDMHPGAFTPGQCVRTRLANVLSLIVAVEDNHFDLYLDRSHALYLGDWLAQAGEDPSLVVASSAPQCSII